ncbi:MAG: PQQ-binding-like beta-propeller repeat protein [Archangium sp.]|nr:PQQ-binding-like beta-propeller repeat protein [Archangium sp.]
MAVEVPPPPPAPEPPPPPKPAFRPGFDGAANTESLAALERGVLDGGTSANERQVFVGPYSTLDGVLTFRGGPERTGGAWGEIPENPRTLEVAWKRATTHGQPPWFGGSGWTGQPVIVRWPSVIRRSMTSLGRWRDDEQLVEVIQGSLDGSVYFFDLRTGQPTRKPLRTGNPIKGSVSLDPRGTPLLFVGQGIPRKVPIGLRVYELVTQREVFFLPGSDRAAPRREWGAFDSSGLLNRATDTYLVGGENGLLYLLKLNTVFDPLALTLSLAPHATRYRYREEGNVSFGIENSLSVAGNLAFFADNGGTIQALDLRTFEPRWAFDAGDDTDASITIDYEDAKPVLYTGCEVDKTGPKGHTHLRKLDGLTGAVQWERSYACQGARTPKKIDAGVFATNAVGTGDVADLVFFTLARCPGPDNGLVVALRKATGEEAWRLPLAAYSWSSPTLLTARGGKRYLLQGGIGGTVRLLEAATGKQVAKLKLEGDIESSPAVFDDLAVLGTRGDRIYGIRIR